MWVVPLLEFKETKHVNKVPARGSFISDILYQRCSWLWEPTFGVIVAQLVWQSAAIFFIWLKLTMARLTEMRRRKNLLLISIYRTRSFPKLCCRQPHSNQALTYLSEHYDYNSTNAGPSSPNISFAVCEFFTVLIHSQCDVSGLRSAPTSACSVSLQFVYYLN